MLFRNALLFVTALTCCCGSGKIFENEFSVTREMCLEKSMPLTSFSLQYPPGLEVNFPDNGRDHIDLQLRTGNLVLEELWVRTEKFTRAQKDSAMEWLDSYVDRYRINSTGMTIDFVGLDKFNGEDIHQIRAIVDFEDLKPVNYSGPYKMISLLKIPDKEDINAVVVTMIAHPDSEIKEFADFQSKGIVGKIWKTFTYAD